MKSFAIYILGCKVNHYEATYVRQELIKNNYQEVSFNEKADIYIIFTCCVTNTAESKTRKYINRAIKNNKDAYIAVVGCYAQLNSDKEEFKNYDLIVGSNNKSQIVEHILNNKKANLVNKDIINDFEPLKIDDYPGRSKAFLKIQDGCNQYCSYCIIPYARGKERSKNFDDVINEAKVLAKKYPELILTGIHTGRYNSNGKNLYDLMSELLKIEDLKLLRLSSIEINEITDDILKLFSNPKMSRNIHIPVQSLNNDVLKRMNRPYTYEEYLNRINYIRDLYEDISISTDLIVGFPDESNEIFEDILNHLDEIRFSFIHVFPYSRKKGTKADKFDNHIDQNEKKIRVNEIITKQKYYTNLYHEKFINKIVNIYIEKTDDKYSYGYSREYFYVKIKGIFNTGEMIEVKILEVNDDNIIGEYVTK